MSDGRFSISRLTHLSLAARIRLGFGALVVLGVVVGVMSVLREQAADRRLRQFVELSRLKDRITATDLAVARVKFAEARFRNNSTAADQEQVKESLAAAAAALGALKERAGDQPESPRIAQLQASLEQHIAREQRFAKLARSGFVSVERLKDVGARLSTSANELVASVDRDVPADQSFAVHLIDRRILLMRISSLRFQVLQRAVDAKDFANIAKSVDTVMESAKPALGSSADDLPPLRDLVHEYTALFNSWADNVQEVDKIFVGDLQAGLDQETILSESCFQR